MLRQRVKLCLRVILRQPRGQESSRVEATSAPRPRVQQSGGYVSPEAKSTAEWRLRQPRGQESSRVEATVEATLAQRPRVLQSGGYISRGPESSRVEAKSAQRPRVQQGGGYVSSGPESSRVGWLHQRVVHAAPHTQTGGSLI
ncbi:unnamed protein product [Arctogadus glacialis]